MRIMQRLKDHSTGAVIGFTVASVVVGLIAQEAQVINRPLAVTQGHVTISRGVAISGGGVARDYRVNTAKSSATAVTFTAAEVLTGLITRGGMIGAVTDVLPTAANLYAAMPGAQPGTSFWLVIDTSAPTGTFALNGASSGVTYGEPCAAAVGTNENLTVLIVFTAITSPAYRAVCVPGAE